MSKQISKGTGLYITDYRGDNKTVIVIINKKSSKVGGVGIAVNDIVSSSEIFTLHYYIKMLKKNYINKMKMEKYCSKYQLNVFQQLLYQTNF